MFISWAAARRHPKFIRRSTLRGFSEAEISARTLAESRGTATWAKRRAGTTGRQMLNVSVDVNLAVSNNFALT